MTRESLFPSRPVVLGRALLAAVVIVVSGVSTAWGWGAGHRFVTEGAMATLPQWQKDLLGKELALLGSQHCFIPDLVYAKKEVRKYAMMDSKPDKFYLVELHLPPAPTESYEILRFFMAKAVEQFKSGRVDEGARYLGTLSHALEDWGAPAHSVPGDNMFTLMKQFVPPTDEYRYLPMHSPMEGGTFTVDLGDYKPRLLGCTVEEAAFNLLHRVQQSTIHARSQVVPIMRALYARDDAASNAAQQKAGHVDAEVVADAVYTVLCLGQSRFEPRASEALDRVDLSPRITLETPTLAWPQSAFFSKPYWGHPTRGVCMRGGKEVVAIRVKGADDALGDKPIEDAVAVGTKTTLTYLVPAGVYDRLEVWAALQAELGAGGDVIFEVKGGDGRTLAKVQVRGDQPAQRVAAPLAGQSTVQLITTSGSADSTHNYAVWARPRLVKAAK